MSQSQNAKIEARCRQIQRERMKKYEEDHITEEDVHPRHPDDK